MLARSARGEKAPGRYLSLLHSWLTAEATGQAVVHVHVPFFLQNYIVEQKKAWKNALRMPKCDDDRKVVIVVV